MVAQLFRSFFFYYTFFFFLFKTIRQIRQKQRVRYSVDATILYFIFRYQSRVCRIVALNIFVANLFKIFRFLFIFQNSNFGIRLKIFKGLEISFFCAFCKFPWIEILFFYNRNFYVRFSQSRKIVRERINATYTVIID